MRSALNLFDSLFAIGLIQIPMWKPAACSNPREIDWNWFSGRARAARIPAASAAADECN